MNMFNLYNPCVLSAFAPFKQFVYVIVANWGNARLIARGGGQ